MAKKIILAKTFSGEGITGLCFNSGACLKSQVENPLEHALFQAISEQNRDIVSIITDGGFDRSATLGHLTASAFALAQRPTGQTEIQTALDIAQRLLDGEKTLNGQGLAKACLEYSQATYRIGVKGEGEPTKKNLTLPFCKLAWENFLLADARFDPKDPRNFMEVIDSRNPEAVKDCLERGADPNGKVTFPNGDSVLMLEAAIYSGSDATLALLAAGADANAITTRLRTPMTLAQLGQKSGLREEAKEALLEAARKTRKAKP